MGASPSKFPQIPQALVNPFVTTEASETQKDYDYERQVKTVKLTPTVEALTLKESELSCPVQNCVLPVTRSTSISSHLRKHLKEYSNLPDDVALKIGFHCPVVTCEYSIKESGKFFARLKVLKQHYLKVHIPKAFKCQHCYYCAPAGNLLSYHQQFCPGDFLCTLCARSYKNMASLRQHVKFKIARGYSSHANCAYTKTFDSETGRYLIKIICNAPEGTANETLNDKENNDDAIQSPSSIIDNGDLLSQAFSLAFTDELGETDPQDVNEVGGEEEAVSVTITEQPESESTQIVDNSGNQNTGEIDSTQVLDKNGNQDTAEEEIQIVEEISQPQGQSNASHGGSQAPKPNVCRKLLFNNHPEISPATTSTAQHPHVEEIPQGSILNPSENGIEDEVQIMEESTAFYTTDDEGCDDLVICEGVQKKKRIRKSTKVNLVFPSKPINIMPKGTAPPEPPPPAPVQLLVLSPDTVKFLKNHGKEKITRTRVLKIRRKPRSHGTQTLSQPRFRDLDLKVEIPVISKDPSPPPPPPKQPSPSIPPGPAPAIAIKQVIIESPQKSSPMTRETVIKFIASKKSPETETTELNDGDISPPSSPVEVSVSQSMKETPIVQPKHKALVPIRPAQPQGSSPRKESPPSENPVYLVAKPTNPAPGSSSNTLMLLPVPLVCVSPSKILPPAQDFGTQTTLTIPIPRPRRVSKEKAADPRTSKSGTDSSDRPGGVKRKRTTETQTARVRVRISAETQTAHVTKRRRCNRKKVTQTLGLQTSPVKASENQPQPEPEPGPSNQSSPSRRNFTQNLESVEDPELVTLMPQDSNLPEIDVTDAFNEMSSETQTEPDPYALLGGSFDFIDFEDSEACFSDLLEFVSTETQTPTQTPALFYTPESSTYADLLSSASSSFEFPPDTHAIDLPVPDSRFEQMLIEEGESGITYLETMDSETQTHENKSF